MCGGDEKCLRRPAAPGEKVSVEKKRLVTAAYADAQLSRGAQVSEAGGRAAATASHRTAARLLTPIHHHQVVETPLADAGRCGTGAAAERADGGTSGGASSPPTPLPPRLLRPKSGVIFDRARPERGLLVRSSLCLGPVCCLLVSSEVRLFAALRTCSRPLDAPWTPGRRRAPSRGPEAHPVPRLQVRPHPRPSLLCVFYRACVHAKSVIDFCRAAAPSTFLEFVKSDEAEIRSQGCET